MNRHLIGWYGLGKNSKNEPRSSPPPFALAPQRVLPLRVAAFAPSVEVDVRDAVGKIAAENRIACPPGIPVVTAGEKIGPLEKKLLLDSGIFQINVIK